MEALVVKIDEGKLTSASGERQLEVIVRLRQEMARLRARAEELMSF